MKIAVPSALSTEGKVVLSRRFEFPAAMEGKVFKFVAYGINYSAEVFINEIFVGKHEGGYTTFSFPVPESALQGGSENLIRIVVENSLNARSTLPLRQQIWGWKNYGGIFRDIFLVALPPVWTEDAVFAIQSIDPKSLKLGIHALVSAKDFSTILRASQQSPPTFTFSAEVIEKSTGTVAGKSAPVAIEPRMNKDVDVETIVSLSNAKLWSPDRPDLYSVRMLISTGQGKSQQLVDEYVRETGIRTVAKNKELIFLNGAPLKLRGVAWTEDSPHHGSAMTYEEMEKDIALIKNLGANAVRIAFHPPHPYLLQLCDQYGLVVLEEIPIYEVPAEIMAAENFRSLAENYFREMVRRDRNHPSVIAWGLGDGFESTEVQSRVLIDQLVALAKSLDNRLTYYVSRSTEDEANSQAVDIAALSLMQQNAKEFRSAIVNWKRSHPDQPVLVGRYGKEIESGNRNGYSDPMSQEAQARFLYQRYETIRQADIAGSFIWMFADWRGDRPMMTVNSSDPKLYTQGIVELSREKKVSYDVVRSMFFGEKISALPIGTHASSTPVSYVLVGLILLILFAWLLNSNRRFRENVSRALLRSYNFFADIRDQRILSLLHTTALALIISVTFGIVASSILYHYRGSIVLDYLLSHFVTSDGFKTLIVGLVWNPFKCIWYFSLIVLVKIVLLAFLIQILAFLLRSKVYFFHSYSVAVWSELPLVLFIPLGMILYRVMESDIYVIPVLVLFLVVMIWIFFRLLKGMSIIYDVRAAKVYAIAIVSMALLAGAWYAYYDYTYSTGAYIHFMLNTLVPESR